MYFTIYKNNVLQSHYPASPRREQVLNLVPLKVSSSCNFREFLLSTAQEYNRVKFLRAENAFLKNRCFALFWMCTKCVSRMGAKLQKHLLFSERHQMSPVNASGIVMGWCPWLAHCGYCHKSTSGFLFSCVYCLKCYTNNTELNSLFCKLSMRPIWVENYTALTWGCDSWILTRKSQETKKMPLHTYSYLGSWGSLEAVFSTMGSFEEVNKIAFLTLHPVLQCMFFMSKMNRIGIGISNSFDLVGTSLTAITLQL